MLYMSGNSIQIFSILILVMLLFNSVKTILSVNSTFDKLGIPTPPITSLSDLFDFQSNPMLLPKLAFIGIQLGNLALGIWKCGGMGLLPTAQSDWLAFMTSRPVLEMAYGQV